MKGKKFSDHLSDDLNEVKKSFRFRYWRGEINSNLFVFCKWITFSIITGLVIGVIGALFHHGIEIVSEFRGEHYWVYFLMPVAGLLIVFLYHVTDMTKDKGTVYVLDAVRDATPLKLRTAPLIFISTILTHLVGGSAGREGAALQLGGSIASFIGQKMRLDEKDKRIMVMAGMSAGFAALFGTPLASAIFAMEVVSVGVMYYAALVPCILAALIAQTISSYLHVTPTSFDLTEVPGLSGFTLVQVSLLGLACAFVAVVFCLILHLMPKIYKMFTLNPYIKVLIGSAIMIIATLLIGTDYDGAGMNIIDGAVAGHVVWYAFILKMLLTAVTLGAGFKGGEIVPAFFTGATFGCAIAPVLALPSSFGAAVGIVAVFCGVTNCPITSILLSYELFGGKGVALFALAISVSYLMSGYWSLYGGTQKVMYSKTKTEFINRQTH